MYVRRASRRPPDPSGEPMLRSRLARAFVLLVLVVGQAAFALPHRALAEGVMAQAMAAHGGAGDDCHSGMQEHAGMPAHAGMAEQQQAPSHSCGCCQGSMPASHGGDCLVMASCGPSSAAPSAFSQTLLPVDVAAEFAPAISAPAAHDFIPDPPPPRA